jgi:hypothetical protein
MKTNIHFLSYIAQFVLERDVSGKFVTHLVFSNSPPPPRIMPFMRCGMCYSRPGETTDDNMAHVQCMLDT